MVQPTIQPCPIKSQSLAKRRAHIYFITAFAFVAIFFFSAVFPFVVIAAGLMGLLGAHVYPKRFILTHEGVASDPRGSGNAGLGAGQLHQAHRSLLRAFQEITICIPICLAPTILAILMLGGESTFTQIGWFFIKLAVLTFGDGYEVLAYMAQQVVEAHSWLVPVEILDGLGLAETPPGPLIMVLQFVRYLAAYHNPGVFEPLIAGMIRAMLATWVIFVPCFLIIFLSAPYIKSSRSNTNLIAALSGITAAIIDIVLNLTGWFGMHVGFKEVGLLEIGPLALLIPVFHIIDFLAISLSLFALWLILCKAIGLACNFGIDCRWKCDDWLCPGIDLELDKQGLCDTPLRRLIQEG